MEGLYYNDGFFSEALVYHDESLTELLEEQGEEQSAITQGGASMQLQARLLRTHLTRARVKELL